MKKNGHCIQYLLSLVIVLMLVGCETGVVTTPPPVSVSTNRPVVVPIASLVTVNFCDDTTTSYPRPYFEQAKQLMADWIEQLVRPAEDGATVFVQLITHDSYDPSSTVQTIVVPPLPPDPAPPRLLPMPTPSDTTNPFEAATATAVSSQAIATVKEANDKAQTDYQNVLINQREHLNRAKTRVKRETQELRALNPAPDNQSSDIWGCIQRASERLQGVGGKKYLLIASDMEMTGPQERSAIQQLQGTTVLLFFYYCEHAQPCSDKTAYWQAAFKRSHAAAVRVFEPSQSLTLTNPLLA